MALTLYQAERTYRQGRSGEEGDAWLEPACSITVVGHEREMVVDGSHCTNRVRILLVSKYVRIDNIMKAQKGILWYSAASTPSKLM